MTEEVCQATVSAKHRNRLPEEDVARQVFGEIARQEELSHQGQRPGESLHGLLLNVWVTPDYARAGWEAAVEMAREMSGGTRRATLGKDQGYDTQDLVEQRDELNMLAHVVESASRRASAVCGWAEET